MDFKKIIKFADKGNNKYILVIILVGISFMLFAPKQDKKSEKTKEISIYDKTSEDEKRLCDILSKINGVGDVDVMITYYSTTASDIAYEEKRENSQREGGDNEINTDESVSNQAVTKSGEPFVVRCVYPEVKGVVVCAKGAGNVTIRSEIVEAVGCAMGVGAHKICVLEKGD